MQQKEVSYFSLKKKILKFDPAQIKKRLLLIIFHLVA